MSLWVPTGAQACRPHTPRPNVIADILRDRHIARLNALADDFIDQAAAAALAGNPRRADYLEQYWAERIHETAAHVAAEPLRRIA